MFIEYTLLSILKSHNSRYIVSMYLNTLNTNNPFVFLLNIFDWERFLNNIYFNLNWPGLFAGPKKLQKILLEKLIKFKATKNNPMDTKLRQRKTFSFNEEDKVRISNLKYTFMRDYQEDACIGLNLTQLQLK